MVNSDDLEGRNLSRPFTNERSLQVLRCRRTVGRGVSRADMPIIFTTPCGRRSGDRLHPMRNYSTGQRADVLKPLLIVSNSVSIFDGVLDSTVLFDASAKSSKSVRDDPTSSSV